MAQKRQGKHFDLYEKNVPKGRVVDWEKSEYFLKRLENFPEFCSKFLKIQTRRGGELQLLDLNPIQLWIFNKFILPTYRAGKPVRLAILKCRQTGVSTETEALGYQFTIGHPHVKSLVIGQDKDQARNIFQMIRRFDDNLPWEEEGLPKFAKAGDSRNALIFNHPSKTWRGQMFRNRDDVIFLDSSIQVKSGEDRDKLGRSGTYHFVHASEAAWWPDVVASLGSLMVCCHPEPGTFTIIETTANGYNAFHSFWMNLTIDDSDIPSDWQKVFIPWYWDYKYEVDVDVERVFQDEYEESLFKRMKNDSELKEIDQDITDDRLWHKIFWRRKTIRDSYYGDVEYFAQEFPATESEAFRFSGVAAFSAAGLSHLESTVKEPTWVGDIKLEHAKGQHPDEPPAVLSMEPHPRGRLRVLEPPQDGAKYILFADVAEGKAQEGIIEGKSRYDYSCIQVFKYSSMPLKQVAIWHGSIDPDIFGDVVYGIAKWYNNAIAGWEINGPGRSIGMQLVEKHKYSNIYMRRDYDSITKQTVMKPGWRTTSRSKPDAVATAQKFVRDKLVDVFDIATLTELKAFSRIAENKWGGQGCHDDRSIALIILLHILDAENLIESARREFEKKKAKEAKRKRYKPDMSSNYNPVLGSVW